MDLKNYCDFFKSEHEEKLVCNDTAAVRLHGFIRRFCDTPTKPSGFFKKKLSYDSRTVVAEMMWNRLDSAMQRSCGSFMIVVEPQSKLLAKSWTCLGQTPHGSYCAVQSSYSCPVPFMMYAISSAIWVQLTVVRKSNENKYRTSKSTGNVNSV